jgi:polysaccharide deacetylase 2 family uncharacterized protein YibQ
VVGLSNKPSLDGRRILKMVASKGKKKKAARKPKKKQSRWKALVVVGCFGFLLGGLVVFLMLRPDTSGIAPDYQEVADNVPPIHYEEPGGPVEKEFLDKKIQKEQPIPKQKVSIDKNGLPQVAIVIDDMGYNREVCDGLLDLDLNLSFAFLPMGPFTEEQAARAKKLGRDVLLHFPMEAANPKWHPDGNTLTIDMDRTAIGKIFRANIATVPQAIGINNHMGSRFTQNREAMQVFMALVRESNLFFLDSRTSKNSVGEYLAGKMGVRTGRRDVFLDNVREQQAITSQLRKLLEMAEQRGKAVAIGHPHSETLQALEFMGREIRQRARLVGVGELVR